MNHELQRNFENHLLDRGVVKDVSIFNKDHNGVYLHVEVRYGLFYNSLVEDDRSFTLGEIVWFYNQKYYIVKYETNPSDFHLGRKLLHLSKTINDVGYKEGGLVVDSREVKKITRFNK